MRFKIDNLPVEVADILNQAGHEALTIFNQRMKGHPDPRIAQVCQTEARALVTLDLDFADIRAYPPNDYPGLIVLRPRLQDKLSVIAVVTQMLPSLQTEPLERHLWIVDEITIRIRAG